MSRIMATILAAAALLGSCAEPETSPPPGEPRLRAASQGLCQAEALASEGQVGEAERVFDAETHDYLHELARMLQEVDPAAAAELLEAKQRVESALAEGEGAAGTEDLLAELQIALQDAAEAADLPRTLCEQVVE
jgi:hypothetical protein